MKKIYQRFLVFILIINPVLFLTGRSVLSDSDDKPQIFIQNGHDIQNILISPDGNYIVTTGTDKHFKIWDLRNGLLIYTLTSSADHIYYPPTFTPDGKSLIWADSNHTFSIFDLSTGKEIKAYRADMNPIFSSNMSVMAYTNGYYLNSIIDWKTKKVICRIGDSIASEATFLNNDGSILITQAYNNEGCLIKWWEAPTGRLIRQIQGGKIISIRKDGLYFVNETPSPKCGGKANCSYLNLELREVSTGKLIRLLDGEYSFLNYYAFFSDDNSSFITVTKKGEVRIFDGSSGKLIKSIIPDTGNIPIVDAKGNGNFLIVEMENHDLIVWDLNENKLIKKLDEVKNGIFDFEADILAFVNKGGQVTIRKIGTWELLNTLNEFSDTPITSLSFSKSSGKIAWGDTKGSVKILDLLEGNNIELIKGFSEFTRKVVLDPSGKMVVAAGCDDLGGCTEFCTCLSGDLKVWDTGSGKLILRFDSDKSSFYAPSFSADGRYLAYVSSSGDNQGSLVTIWNIRKGKIEKKILSPAPVTTISFNNKGTELIAAGISNGENGINIYNVRTGKLVGSLLGDTFIVSTIALSPDGKILASSGTDERLYLWNMKNQKILRSIEYFKCGTRSMTISPDNNTIASDVISGQIFIYGIISRNFLNILDGHDGCVTSIHFINDASHLLSSGCDSTIRFWTIDQETPLLTLHVLSNNQWVAYTPDGYFDASKEGKKLISWKIGNEVYSSEKFWNDYYRPGLLTSIVKGEPIK